MHARPISIGRACVGYAILVRIFRGTQELFSERDNVVSSEQFFLEDVRFVSAGGNLHDIIAVIEINFRFIADDDAFSFAGFDFEMQFGKPASQVGYPLVLGGIETQNPGCLPVIILIDANDGFYARFHRDGDLPACGFTRGERGRIDDLSACIVPALFVAFGEDGFGRKFDRRAAA